MPWEHEPNRGFLRALHALGVAAADRRGRRGGALPDVPRRQQRDSCPALERLGLRKDEARNRPLPRFRTSSRGHRALIAGLCCLVRASDTILPITGRTYGGAVSALDVWGLDDVAETAYRAMLRNPDLDPRAGSPPRARLTGEGGRRAAAGRAGRGQPRTPSGSRPRRRRRTLAALVHVSSRTWRRRRARLDAVRPPCRLRRRPHGRAVPGLVEHAVRAAQRGGVVRRGRGPPARDHRRGRLLPPGRRHRRRRADVRRADRAPARCRAPDARPLPAEVLADPARLAYVRAGPRPARRCGCCPSRCRPSRSSGRGGAGVGRWERGRRLAGRILVRAPALVALVTELFEQYWARGPCRSALGDGQAADDRPVLELLQPGSRTRASPASSGSRCAPSAAGWRGDGRAGCEDPVPGGYGGCAPRADLMSHA